jgi:hypothetical protein
MQTLNPGFRAMLVLTCALNDAAHPRKAAHSGPQGAFVEHLIGGRRYPG